MDEPPQTLSIYTVAVCHCMQYCPQGVDLSLHNAYTAPKEHVQSANLFYLILKLEGDMYS